MSRAIDYAGIRDNLKSILEGDSATAGAGIFIEEDPQFGLSDIQQVIFICMDGRTAPNREQTMSAGRKTQYNLQCTLVTAFFSMEGFKAACDGRDALLGQMELVLMKDRTIGGLADSSWLMGGPMFSVRNSQANVWAAVAETNLVIDVGMVNT